MFPMFKKTSFPDISSMNSGKTNISFLENGKQTQLFFLPLSAKY